EAGDTDGSSAMGAAEVATRAFNAVADDSAAAMLARRRKRVDRGLEAVEPMRLADPFDLKALVVVVTTQLARRRSIVACVPSPCRRQPDDPALGSPGQAAARD